MSNVRRVRCFTVEVDGQPVRVQGDSNMSPESFAALEELMRAAIARATALAAVRPPWKCDSPCCIVTTPHKHPISTRRVQAKVVHEMADRGTGTMCGLDLDEPWTWTEKRVNCHACRVSIAAAKVADTQSRDRRRRRAER